MTNKDFLIVKADIFTTKKDSLGSTHTQKDYALKKLYSATVPSV